MLKQWLLSISSKVQIQSNSVRQKLKLEVYHEASPPKLVGFLNTTVG